MRFVKSPLLRVFILANLLVAIGIVCLLTKAGNGHTSTHLDTPGDIATQVRQHVAAWQLTARDRAFSDIGWNPRLLEAQQTSARTGVPIFLLTALGRIDLARS